MLRLGFLLASFCIAPLLVSASANSFDGVVKGVDAEAGKMIVEDSTSKTVLEGMAGSGDIAIYGEGAKVRGRAVSAGGKTYLENIWPGDAVAYKTMLATNQHLRRDTASRGIKAYRSIGDAIPRFALWDQQGKLFHSTSLRGKAVVVNFIFTRCMSPNMCPAATRKMSALQDAAREAGLEDKVHFVSITLDPDYDTPGVFHAYADSYGIEPANFSFLGGDKQAVEDLKVQLGILTEDDPQMIVNHTMRTIIVSPEGKVTYQVPGSGWDQDDFLKRLKEQVK